jgi:hypothetical protein
LLDASAYHPPTPSGTRLAIACRMKHTSFTSTVLLSLVLACGQERSVEPAPSPEETEAILAATAAEMAHLTADPVLRRSLADRIAERRTGDFELPFFEAEDLVLTDGRTLRDALAFTEIERLERAQIAVPGGVDGWTEDARIEATWAPLDEGLDRHLEIFAADGEVRTASGDERPDGEILVVSLGERWTPIERRARDKAPIEVGTNRSALAARSCGGQTCTSANCRETYFSKIMIYDDKEPWYKGDPEIYMLCTHEAARPFEGPYVECAYDDHKGVDEVNSWYSAVAPIFAEQFGQHATPLLDGLRSAEPLKCWVIERDEGLVSNVDADDSLGSARVAYEDAATKTYYADFAKFVLTGTRPY